MLTEAATSFGTLLSAQLILGTGESASLPTVGKVVRQWFPPSERDLATAIFNAGTFAGPALAAPVAAWLVLHTGWRLSFVMIGSLGFVWLILWLRIFREPSACSWLPEEEKQYLLSATNAQTTASAPVAGALSQLLSRRTIWGVVTYPGLLRVYGLPVSLLAPFLPGTGTSHATDAG
jgi:ACS family glucarate transporter-like MFS transporter